MNSARSRGPLGAPGVAYHSSIRCNPTLCLNNVGNQMYSFSTLNEKDGESSTCPDQEALAPGPSRAMRLSRYAGATPGTGRRGGLGPGTRRRFGRTSRA